MATSLVNIEARFGQHHKAAEIEKASYFEKTVMRQ